MDKRFGSEPPQDDNYAGHRSPDLIVVRSSQSHDIESRRLGGAAWIRGSNVPTGQISSEALLVVAPTLKRTPRRPRRWYSRPVPVALLILLIVAGSLGGYALNRVTRAMGDVQHVSTPPPVVTTSDEELGTAEFTIDTQPAMAALQESGVVPANDAGLLGQFQNGASDLGDLAGGAAAAAGISGGSQTARTVLMLGVDARPGAAIDVGVRSDTIMLVRLDPAAGTCRVLSVPRDTQVNLPGYGLSKINHALLVGGIPYQQMVIEQTLGITVDNYALIDFNAFKELVDTVGGIEINIPASLVHDDGRVAFAAGPQFMDGATALIYARFRSKADGGDQARVERQWNVLRALGEKADRGDVVRDIDTLLPALSAHLRTDLSASELAGLAESMDGRCTSETVETEQLNGNRVRQQDAILQQPLYFNIVGDAVLRERVQWLLS